MKDMPSNPQEISALNEEQPSISCKEGKQRTLLAISPHARAEGCNNTSDQLMTERNTISGEYTGASTEREAKNVATVAMMRLKRANLGWPQIVSNWDLRLVPAG